jgi:hypothetical protein
MTGQRQALIALAEENRPPATDVDRINANGSSVDDQMRLVGGGNDIFVTVGIICCSPERCSHCNRFLPRRQPDLGHHGHQQLAGGGNRHAAKADAAFKHPAGAGFRGLRRFRCSRIAVGPYRIPSQINAFRCWRCDQKPASRLGARRRSYRCGSGLFLPVQGSRAGGVIAVAVTGLAFLGAIVFYHDQLTPGQSPHRCPNSLRTLSPTHSSFRWFAGCLIFAVAVALDLRDRERQTVWSDCAFWLHVVSAPLLVHPLFILSTGQEVLSGQIEPGISASILLGLMITTFVIVALAIDRRSLLAPTLPILARLGSTT